MYRIRCFLFQQPHVTGAALAPYYVLKVHKADLLGLEQQRVLTLDLLSGTMQNWKKDEAHRVTPLSDLKEVQLNGPTSIILSFSTPGSPLAAPLPQKLHQARALVVSPLRPHSALARVFSL